MFNILTARNATPLRNPCMAFMYFSQLSFNSQTTIFRSCYSMIGMQGRRQDISIGPRCYYKGIVIHEMMHALGFWHEQSRLDRDRYITIHWQNIIPCKCYHISREMPLSLPLWHKFPWGERGHYHSQILRPVRDIIMIITTIIIECFNSITSQ